MMQEFKKQIKTLGNVKKVWMTTFNLNIDFVERHLLPAILDMDPPRNRLDYESFQLKMAKDDIQVRIFCDKRILMPDQYKRTAVAIHPVSPRAFRNVTEVDDQTLFHPKVIYLENDQNEAVLGAGSANLTVGGWGRNQEAFVFRRVSSKTQRNQIKEFFETLREGLDLGAEMEWNDKLKLQEGDPDWEFVHSFTQRSFLERLFENGHAKQLSVWSPYLSTNLPALINRLRGISRNPKLNVALVADRLENRYFRTPWSEALAECLEDESLRFYESPSQRHDNTEMTHAKIWLARGEASARLAVGSWNFTEPGTSSLDRRNIEAGILLHCPVSSQITGKRLEVSADNFASQEILLQDALKLPDELPFDLQVTFDWKQAVFNVSGVWHEGQPVYQYTLRLPGVTKPRTLVWKDRRSGGVYPLEPIENLSVPDNEQLLADHSFAIQLEGKTVYRGLVLETNQEYRRSLDFDSLKDLIDNLISGTAPMASGMTTIRKSLHSGVGPDEDDPLPNVKIEQDALSYFRLFQAIEQFRKRLQDVKSQEELQKWLFAYPGCLQELVTKTHQQIQESAQPVFNWFLAQEVHSLYPVAQVQLERFREHYARKQVPERWSSLEVRLPKLPRELSLKRNYLRRVLEECGYAAR
ncbi:hypothetical protein CEK28_12930 [Xenophilus sp. AP218F]|nr:hypothetical protein CEK28_12930 [Xenophilus sp. AP218F]